MGGGCTFRPWRGEIFAVRTPRERVIIVHSVSVNRTRGGAVTLRVGRGTISPLCRALSPSRRPTPAPRRHSTRWPWRMSGGGVNWHDLRVCVRAEGNGVSAALRAPRRGELGEVGDFDDRAARVADT
jgi:hypothetical protein